LVGLENLFGMSGLRIQKPELEPREQFRQPCASTLAFQLLTISKAANFVKREIKNMSDIHSYSVIFQYQ
jgi:hypothetical protein